MLPRSKSSRKPLEKSTACCLHCVHARLLNLVRCTIIIPQTASLCRTAALIGLIMRQATIILPQVPMPAVLAALAEAVRDNSKVTKLKKRLMGALGEGLFFAVTQVGRAAERSQLGAKL